MSPLEQFAKMWPETNHPYDEERLCNAVLSKKDQDIYKVIEELKNLLSAQPLNEEQKTDIVSRFENLWHFQDFLNKKNCFK